MAKAFWIIDFADMLNVLGGKHFIATLALVLALMWQQGFTQDTYRIRSIEDLEKIVNPGGVRVLTIFHDGDTLLPWPGISKFENLEGIEINAVDPKIFVSPEIARLPNLKWVSFNHQKQFSQDTVTIRSMKELDEVLFPRRVRVLYFEHEGKTLSIGPEIAAFESLEGIEISAHVSQLIVSPEIAQLPKLKWVTFIGHVCNEDAKDENSNALSTLMKNPEIRKVRMLLFGEDCILSPSFQNNLEALEIRGDYLSNAKPTDFKNLRHLSIRDMQYYNIVPETVYRMEALETLKLEESLDLAGSRYNWIASHNEIHVTDSIELSPMIGRLTRLRSLRSDYYLRLPEEITSLSSLTDLRLFCPTQADFELLARLPNLEGLEILYSSTQPIPDGLCQLQRLQRLSIIMLENHPARPIDLLPACIGNLKNLFVLKLESCNNDFGYSSTQFPSEAVELERSNWGSLPKGIGELLHLDSLILRYFPVTGIEAVTNCAELAHLEVLYSYSKHFILPRGLDRLQYLESLDIRGNNFDMNALPKWQQKWLHSYNLENMLLY